MTGRAPAATLPVAARARRPRAPHHRRARPDHPVRRAGQPGHAQPAARARGRPDGRAGRPRGTPSGARHARDRRGRGPHPPPVRRVPPALPLPRPGARAVRRPHVRPGRRRPRRGPARRAGRPRVAGRAAPARRPRHLRPEPGRPDPGQPRGRAPASDAEVVAVPLAAHGDPAADHDLGVAVVANYAGPDPVHALAETDRRRGVPRGRSPRSSTPTGRPPTSRGWCCSSPGCPAAASRRWPGR